MPLIPESVRTEPLQGLSRISQGKVSDLYMLPGHPGLMLKVISDRASVHDIILPFTVSGKGVVLNIIDHFWRQQLLSDDQCDLVAIGSAIDEYLPEPLRGNADLHCRARVIRECTPVKAELIYRRFLTGTGWKQYQENNGVICGQQFPNGLNEWAELNPVAFTPTTKASTGHDEPMLVVEFQRQFGNESVELTRPTFEQTGEILQPAGIVIADTKFEVGLFQGNLVVIDEVLTPDSSRYLRLADVLKAQQEGTKPPSFDKQPVRDYVSEQLGVGPKTELTDAVVQKVHEHSYPESLIRETQERYQMLVELVTGKPFDEQTAGLRSGS